MKSSKILILVTGMNATVSDGAIFTSKRISPMNHIPKPTGMSGTSRNMNGGMKRWRISIPPGCFRAVCRILRLHSGAREILLQCRIFPVNSHRKHPSTGWNGHHLHSATGTRSLPGITGSANPGGGILLSVLPVCSSNAGSKMKPAGCSNGFRI